MGRDGHWQRFLLPEERLIHTFGVSRSYLTVFFLLPALVLLVLGVVIGALGELVGALFLLAGGGMLLPAFFMWFFVHYAITDRRVMSRVGVLGKHSISVDLTMITDVAIREPFWERLITRSGTIGINTAGSPRVELVLRHVGRPFDRKQDIYKHRHQAVVYGQQQHQGERYVQPGEDSRS